jgi:SulP family sulfate permease
MASSKHEHDSRSIRDSTNRLASLSFAPSSHRPRRQSHGSSDGASHSTFSAFQHSTSPLANRDHRPYHPSHLNPALASGESPQSPAPVPSALTDQGAVADEGGFSPGKSFVAGSAGHVGRSGLSVMFERERVSKAAGLAASPIAGSPNLDATPKMPKHSISSDSLSFIDDEPTPLARKTSLLEEGAESDTGEDEHSDDPNSSSALRRYFTSESARDDVERATERTSLLQGHTEERKGFLSRIEEAKRRAKKITPRDVVRSCVEEPIKNVPSVILGLLLNVLDGVSYGMIL